MSEKKKKTKAVNGGFHEDKSAEEIMRMYDKESATRIWEGTPKLVVRIVMALFSLYCIWSTLFSTADLPIRLTAFLGLVTIMGYLTYPVSKHHATPNHMPWYDIAIMIAGAASFFYYCFNYMTLVKLITSAAKINPSSETALPNAWIYIVIGIVGILALAELCRRCVGLPILIVVGALLVYTFASGQNLARVVYTMFYGTSGIMATPVQVCLKFIAVFIIFGGFLERTGIASLFIDLANCVCGSASGGPAKVAVVASALEGMVSGSSVGNTVGSGSVTIPMMKKTGYKPEFAAAVEAAASTGGQIMPPIMGAAAFLMAEYMGVPYGQVALWAILPAVLYFTGIFISVHLEAKKTGLRGIPKAELPRFKGLLKQLYLLIPLVILIWMVSTNIRSLQFSATIAILAAIVVSLPAKILQCIREKREGVYDAAAGTGKANAFTEKVWRPVKRSTAFNVVKGTGNMTIDSLEAGGRGCITVSVACAMAGMIAGCITVTGLASKLVSAIVNISNAIPYAGLALFIALFLTMLCCIILGMGVPTTANYCIMASTCAPILITLGVPTVAAHFFVFYFGIVADITPPVALAAYAGAAIAKSDPMKTGVTATKLAIGAFVVPYIFALNPSMILMNEGVVSAVLIVITSVLGIFGVALSLNGYIFQKMPALLRILSACGGLCMLYPGLVTDIIGFALVGGVVLYQYLSAKKPSADEPRLA